MDDNQMEATYCDDTQGEFIKNSSKNNKNNGMELGK